MVGGVTDVCTHKFHESMFPTLIPSPYANIVDLDADIDDGNVISPSVTCSGNRILIDDGESIHCGNVATQSATAIPIGDNGCTPPQMKVQLDATATIYACVSVDCTDAGPDNICDNKFDKNMFPDLIPLPHASLGALKTAIAAGTVISPTVDCGTRGFIEDATTLPVSIHCGPDTTIATVPTVTSDMNTTYTLTKTPCGGVGKQINLDTTLASQHWICAEIACDNTADECTYSLDNLMLSPLIPSVYADEDVLDLSSNAIGRTIYCKGSLKLIEYINFTLADSRIQCGCPTGMYVDYFSNYSNPKCVDITGCQRSPFGTKPYLVDKGEKYCAYVPQVDKVPEMVNFDSTIH